MQNSIPFQLGYLSQLEEEDSNYYDERDQCIVPQHLWRQWIQEQESDQVLLVEITQDHIKQILCIGAGTLESMNTIFLPIRCFQEFDLSREVSVCIVKTMPPLATKITLQPLDNELYHCDIASAVSKHLMEWQVLTKWTTITVQCEELGGYPVDIFVKTIEPADTVLLRGEVPLELEEPIESIPEWTSQQQEQQQQQEPHYDPFIPEVEEKQDQSSFTPFSGQGRRLGS